MNTHNPANSDATDCNPKSGQEVAKHDSLGHSENHPKSTPSRRTSSRSHADHWKSRLFRPTYTRDGALLEVNDLAVRLQHGRRRETFTLATTNKDAAAIKARDIWTTIKGAGWDAAIERFKPDQDSAPLVDVSVGAFLNAVRETADLRLRTFLNYANCLRTITSEVFGIRPSKGRSKFDYRTGGNQEWTQKIDATKLARLTPELIVQWQRRRVARAGASELAKASARRTCNSYVRCARSLFAPGILSGLKRVTLPDPLPFAGVKLLETGSMKYVSRINAHTLIAAARSELRDAEPECYKAFLLALFAGMRKGEVDLAEWRMLDFNAKVLRLQETEWLHLKTRDSAADITVDEDLLEELRSFMHRATGPFILESPRRPRNDSARTYYRCEATFDRLNAWLRAKGVTSHKPLHELRKEVGAIVATAHGIYAASRYLRHSDITTTARHYADHKARINVGLGKLLDTSLKPVETNAHAAA